MTYVLLFILLPFLIGAAWAFCPLWIAIPTTLILGIMWLGACANIK